MHDLAPRVNERPRGFTGAHGCGILAGMLALVIAADVPPGKPGCSVTGQLDGWLALALVGAALLRRRRS